MKINYGCGNDYREGWVNVDVRQEVKWKSDGKQPDVLLNIDDKHLPFDDSSVDYILLDNVLEHIPVDKIDALLMEFHRILTPKGGVLDIYVPHFTGIGVKYLEHIRGYGINSFWYYEKYFDIQQELMLISRSPCSALNTLKKLNVFNFIFNGPRLWQQACEKFLPGGFEEIRYIMTRKPNSLAM